jgi:hypothetical protein
LPGPRPPRPRAIPIRPTARGRPRLPIGAGPVGMRTPAVPSRRPAGGRGGVAGTDGDERQLPGLAINGIQCEQVWTMTAILER